VREDRQVFLRVIRKENLVAQRHGSIPAEPQYRRAKPTGPTSCTGAVKADAPMIQQGDQRSQG